MLNNAASSVALTLAALSAKFEPLKAEFDRLKAERIPLYEEQERIEAIAKAEFAITTEGSLSERVMSIWERTGCDDAIGAFNQVNDRLHDLAQEIIETPTVSPADFALKARALAFALDVDIQPIDELGDADWDDEIVCRFVEAAERDAAAAARHSTTVAI